MRVYNNKSTLCNLPDILNKTTTEKHKSSQTKVRGETTTHIIILPTVYSPKAHYNKALW